MEKITDPVTGTVFDKYGTNPITGKKELTRIYYKTYAECSSIIHDALDILGIYGYSNQEIYDLYEHMDSIWRYYYIAIPCFYPQDYTVVPKRFKTAFEDVATEHANEYKELFDYYNNKKIEIDDLISSETTSENIDVDLPNKIVAKPSYYDSPSEVSKTTISSTNKAGLLRARNSLMRAVRDLYNEFAMEFRDLFVHAYIDLPTWEDVSNE